MYVYNFVTTNFLVDVVVSLLIPSSAIVKNKSTQYIT